MNCTHDAPKTHYARQGGLQIASNLAEGITFSSGSVMPEFFGALCDDCATAAGLMPTAFGRALGSAS